MAAATLRVFTTSKGERIETHLSDAEAVQVLTDSKPASNFARSLLDQYRTKGRLSQGQWPWLHKLALEAYQKTSPDAQAEAERALAAAKAARDAALAASRATDSDLEIPVPDGLAYLPYQRGGIAYALDVFQTGRAQGVMIADEMGLGKTIQAIGIVNAEPSVERVLVICPASLKVNWSREMAKWLVRPLSIGIADGGDFPDTEVAIVNFDILARHEERIRATHWHLAIVDEAHYAKNTKAIRSVMIFGGKVKKETLTEEEQAQKEAMGRRFKPPLRDVTPIPSDRLVLLTGTPIVNRPAELFPLIHAIDPEGFPSFFPFAKAFCNARHNGWGWDFSGANRERLPELQEKLRARIMVRRLKKDVLKELPPKRRQVIELPANGCAAAIKREQEAWARHEAILTELRAAVELSKASDDPEEYNRAVERLREGAQGAFTEMARMRQQVAVAKVPYVVEHVRGELDEGAQEKVLIFAHHLEVIDKLMKAFGDMAVRIDGRMNKEQRQESVDRFQNDPSVKVFVGGIMAAGVGLTLTAASWVVFAELDWVPGNLSQAEDRAHRIGQTDTVLVQHLVLEGSLDATMARRLVEKQEVIDRALDKVGAAREPVVPEPEKERAATASAKREALDDVAKTLTPEQIEAIHAGLRMLAGMDADFARSKNDMGFSRVDVRIGHSLADAPRLTPRQAALGKMLVNKYRRQLPEELVAAAKG